jgi:hypothetical protein
MSINELRIDIPSVGDLKSLDLESSENSKDKSARSPYPISEISYEPVKSIKRKIIKEVIVPSYFSDIQSTMRDRTSWRILSNRVEFFSKILTGLATVIAFASGVYRTQEYLSFIAGCLGTTALVCTQFASYAKSESKKQTEITNKILTKLKIDNIPDLMDDKKA